MIVMRSLFPTPLMCLGGAMLPWETSVRTAGARRRQDDESEDEVEEFEEFEEDEELEEEMEEDDESDEESYEDYDDLEDDLDDNEGPRHGRRRNEWE